MPVFSWPLIGLRQAQSPILVIRRLATFLGLFHHLSIARYTIESNATHLLRTCSQQRTAPPDGPIPLGEAEQRRYAMQNP